MAETQTGLKENVAAVLCYVLGWVSGVVFLILEPNNKLIKFHAIQSIIVFGILNVAIIVFGWIPYIEIVMVPLIGLLIFIMWLVLIVMAAQERKYKVPWAGDWAEKWAA